MKVTIDVTSEEAENILFALALRSKQQMKHNRGAEQQTMDLSDRLNATFEDSFGWSKLDRTAHYRKPIKRVTVTCYDTPPQGVR